MDGRRLLFVILVLLGVFLLMAILSIAAALLAGTQNGQPETQKPSVNGTLEIYFLNVSQGDSEFLRQSNSTMLIDCGQESQGKRIAADLTGMGVYTIDYLVMTHTDFDHIGGCAQILRTFNVRNVIVDGQARDTATYRNAMAALGNMSATVAKKGDAIALGGARLTVIHANTGSQEPNQNSIVMALRFGNFTALFDADCDTDCEQSLLSETIRADVLKVPHHGSAYGSSSAFLQKVSPSLAVIEVGKNDYGHPDNGTLERLGAAGAEILRTDLNGTVKAVSNGSGYSLSN